jgi:hypothetical protein
MARFFGRGSYKIGNVRIITTVRQLEFRVRHADERCRPSFPWSARDTKGR